MDDLVPAFFVMLVGTLLAVLQASRFARWESTLLLSSFAAHLVSVFVQIRLTLSLYGGGDMFGYAWRGEGVAAVLRADFARFGPEVIKILFHGMGVVPVEVVSPGSTTGAMDALAGLLSFITGGSIYTLCAIVTVGAYFGQVALYRAFAKSFPESVHSRLFWASMLIPSVVFWSSGFLKEAVIMVGLGYFVLGLTGIRVTPGRSLLQLFAGALIIGLFKGYVLPPLVLASSAWFYVSSATGARWRLRPVHLVLGAVVAIGGIVVLGRIFPEYALDNLAEQAANSQEIGQNVRGASSYSIGDPTQTSLSGQLMFTPIALATSLYRPALFDVTSAQVAINALETSAILLLTIFALVRRGPLKIWTVLLESPMLVFCLVFIVTFGIPVGLTTTNLGALSRYRMPLVPFLWSLALVLGSKHYASSPAFLPRRPKSPLVAPKKALRSPVTSTRSRATT
jgi:hypothetical protein